MNITKKILLASFISIGIIACSEDDDDSVEPNNNNGGNNSTTLTGGTWEAFEFKDSKGLTYGLNEWVPEYDTVNGCEVVRYEDKTIKDELVIADSTLNYEGEYEYRNRNYQQLDTTCNSITYGNWSTPQGDVDSGTYNYKIMGSNIIIWEDSIANSDTIPYEIRSGLLYIYAGTEDEYYYRKK